MKKLFRFIDPSSKGLEKKLKEHDVETAYVIIHSNGTEEVGGYALEKSVICLQQQGLSIEPLSSAIDWEDQAKQFCITDNRGRIVVDLSQYIHKSKEILLLPGAAFGDTSHPTTRLMLQLMTHYTRDSYIFDIGTGSGILAISSIYFGARKAYGIEIDRAAQKLAIHNVRLNKLSHHVTIAPWRTLEKNLPPTTKLWCILCNMIWSEKEHALQHYKKIMDRASVLILSGTRTPEKRKELHFLKTHGWHIIEEISEEGWIATVAVKDLVG